MRSGPPDERKNERASGLIQLERLVREMTCRTSDLRARLDTVLDDLRSLKSPHDVSEDTQESEWRLAA